MRRRTLSGVFVACSGEEFPERTEHFAVAKGPAGAGRVGENVERIQIEIKLLRDIEQFSMRVDLHNARRLI